MVVPDFLVQQDPAQVNDTITGTMAKSGPDIAESKRLRGVGFDASNPQVSSDDPPYTVFTTAQKQWISLAASFAGMFSTLCSYIYYPALVPIARDLGVSVLLVNLTITSYLIVAAVAPACMGDLADQSGRRPIYILMFTLFIGANVGIALQTSFPALLVLRMLQSAGSSGMNMKWGESSLLAAGADRQQA